MYLRYSVGYDLVLVVEGYGIYKEDLVKLRLISPHKPVSYLFIEQQLAGSGKVKRLNHPSILLRAAQEDSLLRLFDAAAFPIDYHEDNALLLFPDTP